MLLFFSYQRLFPFFLSFLFFLFLTAADAELIRTMCKSSQGEVLFVGSAKVSMFCKDNGIVAVKYPQNCSSLWCLDTTAHLQ